MRSLAHWDSLRLGWNFTFSHQSQFPRLDIEETFIIIFTVTGESLFIILRIESPGLFPCLAFLLDDGGILDVIIIGYWSVSQKPELSSNVLPNLLFRFGLGFIEMEVTPTIAYFSLYFILTLAWNLIWYDIFFQVWSRV